jgi:hypothetical protein
LKTLPWLCNVEQQWHRCPFTQYLCHKLPRICSVYRYHNPILITGFVTRVTRRVTHVEKKLPTIGSTWDNPRCVVGFMFLDLLLSVQCFVHHYLSLFIWPLQCLSFFNLRFLIAPLVCSNWFCTLICVYV